MEDKISVLLVTEGTYPFSQGGVSQWCDILMKRLTAVDYKVFSIVMDPFVTQKFDIGERNELIRVPLWGTEEPSEHLDTPFSSTYLAKQRTTDEVIQQMFIPLFLDLVGELLTEEKNSYVFAETIVALYDFFVQYDYKVCFKSELTWRAYRSYLLELEKEAQFFRAEPDIYCTLQSLGWIYRFFNIINTPVPKTTITHASAASFCGLPCVVSKLKYGTPFLLTEHGIYLREQYLSLSKRGYPSFLNTFLIRMIQSVTDLCYAFADQISPVCAYNMRWEKRLTDRHERIQVIYNGVDHTLFSNMQDVAHDSPTVITVARVDPIKDLQSLQRAALIVKQHIPNVQFLIYGSISVPEYYDECLALNEKLGLQETVHFLGHTSDIVKAYESGDIVVQTSVSEAFPYSIVEAMFAGKPIVSTDVGGISEALGDHGILVTPGDVQGLAEGIIRLLEQPQLASEMASEARQRAMSMFTLEKNLEQYLKSYIKLALVRQVAETQTAEWRENVPSIEPFIEPENQYDEGRIRTEQLLAERGYALKDIGHIQLAIEHFEKAIQLTRHPSIISILWTEISLLYMSLGDTVQAQRALMESQRIEERLHRRRQLQAAERAYALRDLKMYPQAIKLLEQALKEDPNQLAAPIFLLDLVELYSSVGQEEKAKEYLRKFEMIQYIMDFAG
ncbi:GT4 family glycosyltransferase PelF [Alicyclobacillus sp. TC]|uniref:GT4 family glycosyltransferase PelF n=1 Tax=Alicyclobacillus sp. TC TaxID=2606450 RepID=UPI001934489D|nr:GT4 family glycosyltransferase PelF [Alicyclobacillus sp. TC]